MVAAEKAFDQLGMNETSRNYENIHNKNILDNSVTNKGEPLFPRLDANIEVEFIANLMANK